MRCGLDWKDPNFKNYFVSYERFDGKFLTSEQPTGDIVWMALRRGEEEPRIGSAQVDGHVPSVCCVMLLPLLLTLWS